MQQPPANPRVIDPAAPQYNATLVRRVDQHDSLAHFWVRFDANRKPFEAGQYMTVGIFADGRIVQRPFSVASDPDVAGLDGYELYVRLVTGGEFTPLLWRLSVGHRIRMIGPKGRFTLESNDDRTHLFISSGTVAMMRNAASSGAPAARRPAEWCVICRRSGLSRPARELAIQRRLPRDVHPDRVATSGGCKRRVARTYWPSRVYRHAGL
jgi:FAD-dependent oxidoreductase family protein